MHGLCEIFFVFFYKTNTKLLNIVLTTKQSMIIRKVVGLKFSWLEPAAHNGDVGGSSPSSATFFNSLVFLGL